MNIWAIVIVLVIIIAAAWLILGSKCPSGAATLTPAGGTCTTTGYPWQKRYGVYVGGWPKSGDAYLYYGTATSITDAANQCTQTPNCAGFSYAGAPATDPTNELYLWDSSRFGAQLDSNSGWIAGAQL